MTKPETTQQLISYAVDCLTVIVEDEREPDAIRQRCHEARDLIVNALIDVEKSEQDGSGFTMVRSDDLERLMQTCEPIRHADFDAFGRMETALGLLKGGTPS